jgi:hypothetical protein
MTEQRGSAAYEASYQQTLDVVDRFPIGRREEAGVVGEWSLKDAMGHLAFWDAVEADELAAVKSGTEFTFDDSDDSANAREAARRAEWTWDEVMTEVAANRERLIPLLVDPGRTDGEPIHDHWNEHRQQMEAWLAANRIE